MSSYQAGNLDLTIQAISGQAIKSLDEVIERLNTINQGLSKVGGYVRGNGRSGGGTGGKPKGTKEWTEIINKTNSLGKSYNYMSREVSKSEKGLHRVTTYFNEQSEQIKKVTENVDELGNKITDIDQKPKKKKLLDLFSLGKITAVLYTAKRLGRVVGDIVQSGADYVETLNLWRVSMQEFEGTATTFVNKMNEAYGISEKTLMNAQATFKNMLGTLGTISDEMAYGLSESVTKMALDYASLYNVSIEEAMFKFQSALAGQVRPVRAVSGDDITENTLYQLYQSIGGTKTVRQLNQTEKRLLAIYAIFNQMESSGALNDMQRTIESFANQSRIMVETFNETRQFAGLLVTELLDNLGVMTNINSMLSFMSELLKGLATYFGAMERQEIDIFGAVTDGAEDASKAIDDVKGKLIGFDQFRSLSGTEEEDVAIDEALANAISSYNTSIDDSLLESKQMSRQWLEYIGLTYDAETGTYKLSEQFERLAEILPMIGSFLVGIITYFGSKGIMGAITKLRPAFAGLGNIIKRAFDLKTLGIIALISALYYMYTTNEDFRNSVDNLFSVLMDAIGTVIEPFAGLIILIAPILADILTVVAQLLVPIIDIVANVIKLLDDAGLLTSVFMGVAAAIAVVTLAIWAQNAAWLANPVTYIILGIIAAIAILAVVITSIIKNFDSIWETIKNVIRAVGNFFANVGIGIANIFISVVNFCIDLLNALLEPLDATIKLFGGKGIDIPHWDAEISYNPIQEFATGGLPDKGTMFVAGEAGAEMVYNTPNGQSGVANVQQIAQATYQGTMSALRDWWGGMGAKGDIPHLKEANPTGMYEAVTNVAGARGNKWSKV
jgi:hypothetical protein